MSKKTLFFIIISFITFFFAGFSVGFIFYKPLEDKTSELASENLFINPIRINDKKFKESRISDLESELNDLIKDEDIAVSLYYRDLNNGPWFSFNASEKFEGASLYKVPVMLAYFKAAEKNPDILKQKVKLDLDPTDITTLKDIGLFTDLEMDQEYSVQELINEMIIKSDNYSTFSLLDHARAINLSPDPDFTNIELGLKEDMFDLNIVDFAGIFRILYNTEFLGVEMSEKALKILSETEYQNGLTALVPQDLVVSHKFGIRTLKDSDLVQLHDCGIFYVPQNPYILCVMTKGNNQAKQEDLVASIAKTFYDSLSE